MEQTKQEQFIIRRIGGTTYKVRVAFSETAVETMEEKLSLIHIYAARAALPKKRVPVKGEVYDAVSGTAKSTLRFEQQDKGPPSLKPNPASRPPVSYTHLCRPRAANG